MAARALFETIALIVNFEAKLQKQRKANDFGAIDRLVGEITFASRDKEFIASNPEFAAKSVLTYIDHFEKMFPGDLRRTFRSTPAALAPADIAPKRN